MLKIYSLRIFFFPFQFVLSMFVCNATSQSDGGDDASGDPQEVLRECLEKFSTPDYIMEPGIFAQLKRSSKLSVS